MIDEINKWFILAERDFISAKKNFKKRIYYVSAFLCQQSIEKALKALYIKKYQKLLKIHDLVKLAKKVGADINILDICAELNPIYIETRYPDVPTSYNKVDLKKLLKDTEKVLIWIKTNL
ncbi:MAG: HEPN domain-containing protein [Promethearchaeota archaeon]|nr:MAG: HEPN domain-containing protein [Candidatus Lokiarchaeota archaeon]